MNTPKEIFKSKPFIDMKRDAYGSMHNADITDLLIPEIRVAPNAYATKFYVLIVVVDELI